MTIFIQPPLPEMNSDEHIEAQSVVHPRNTLNDLPGDQWLYHTRSVLQTSYPHAFHHDLRKAHGANKPVQLLVWLLETFTKRGMCVLDPFAGVGSSMIAGATSGRRVTGIEISEQWASIYLDILRLHPEWGGQEIWIEDCLTLMADWCYREGVYDPETDLFDFVVFDPPYTVHLKQTMSGKAGTKYGETHANRRSDYDMHSAHEGDLANCADYAAYLERMREVFRLCYALLKRGRYCVYMVQNTYQQGEYSFVQADLAREAKKSGFVPKGEIVWAPAGKRLRPYGYPTAWVPNPVHATLVVLQKPRKS